MNLNLEPFSLIQQGKKTIEMRLYDEKRKKLQIGDIIIFTEKENKNNRLKARVIKLHKYDSFEELYKNFNKIQLGYYENQIANARDMEEYYSKEDIKKYGVVGIEIKVLSKEN